MIASLKKIVPPPLPGVIDRPVRVQPPPLRKSNRDALFPMPTGVEKPDPVNRAPAIELETRAGYISPQLFGAGRRYRMPKWLKSFASPFFISLIFHTSLLLLLILAVRVAAPAGSEVVTLHITENEADDIQPVTIASLKMPMFASEGAALPPEPRPSESLMFTVNSLCNSISGGEPISMNLPVDCRHQGAGLLKSLEHEFDIDVSRKSRNGQENTNQAEFFGIQSSGNRFVFVIDSSTSMAGKRWGRACRELWKSLESLHPDQEFFLVCFDIETHLMMKQKQSDLLMLHASDENITKVKRWTRSVKFGKQTLPMHALQCAISLKPDAIYLLSDGEFHDDSRRFLRNENRSMGEDRVVRAHIPVHTIAVESEKGAKLLKGIAVEQDGKFAFVD